MKARVLVLAAAFAAASSWAALPPRSGLAPEPGTIDIEGMLDTPIRLAVKQEAPIYFLSTMERAVGVMAAGTVVTLVGMSDTGFRVRGRAMHGDVAGWLRKDNFIMQDPKLPDKLKAFYERTKQITELVAAHQVALGMTGVEVQQALGKPTRKSTKVTAAGRVDRLEYAIFEKVPQTTVGRAPDGQLVQSIVYIKVETGTLSVGFKDGIVDEIEETKGNPLQGGQIKIVPGPVFFR